jgi:methionine-rich copper-binding protein CopC
MRIALALLLVGLGLIASQPPQTLAHARLEAAHPAPDPTVSGLTEIHIWFTQELTLRGNDIAITDAWGNRVDNMDAYVEQSEPDRKLLRATVQPLADGVYTVTWTSSSAEDGHSATESYSFSVLNAEQQPIVGRSCSADPDLS